MKLSQTELVALGTIIVYIAFFTHPVPSVISGVLATPIGHAVVLLLTLYVLAYQSLVVGIFLVIAYVMSTGGVTEYLDEAEQTPKKAEPKQPKSSGVPPPAITGLMAQLMKGDTRLPQKAGKTETTPPPVVTPPKPSLAPKVENFASF